MKKIIAFTMCIFLLAAFSACAGSQDSTGARIVKYSGMPVDITINTDGRYALAGGDTYICYSDEDTISNIVIENPFLVGYKVSSEWSGGVYILKQTYGNAALQTLTEVADELRTSGDDDHADRIYEVIHTIESAGPYTGAST